MIDQSSLNLLERARLSPKQASVYLALLELGSASVSQIAETAALKRPITYVVLDELQKLNLAQALPGRTKQYTASDPNQLATELEQLTRDFREMLPYLRSLQQKAGKPHILTYTGLQAVQHALHQIRRPKEARYLTSISALREAMPQEVHRWEQIYQRNQAAKGGQHLLVDSPADRLFATLLQKAGQEVRFLPPNFLLFCDLALIDDSVYLTTLQPEIVLTVIESKAFYDVQQIFFDSLWAQAVVF